MARSYPESWHDDRTASHSASVTHLPIPSTYVANIESAFAHPAELSDDEMERRLESIIKHRQARREYFSDDLFADPAWDILLELALAERQQRRVCISSLCIGAQVPSSTALRWIKHMTDNGWLVRKDDPLDARRKFAELSKDSSMKMRAFLAGLDQGLSV